MMKKISLKKVYNFLKKSYPFILAVVFLSLLAFNLLAYYRYVYSTVNHQAETELQEVYIDQELLEKVLTYLEARQTNLEEIQSTHYPSPFQ